MASEKYPAATRDDHDEFCIRDDWALVRGAGEQPVAHHRTYELKLWDGRILRTRISKPVDRTTYARSMWTHILRHQLEVEADAFWSCVRDRKRPDRGGPAPQAARRAIPLHIVRELQRSGMSEQSILALDLREALECYARIYENGE